MSFDLANELVSAIRHQLLKN